MTREEAIRWLKNIKNVGYIKNLLNHSGAIDMAIKALEQGDISDKIRAEIEKQEKWLMIAGYNTYNVDIAFNSIKSALALDQEPCEDAISRQAAIDIIESWLSCKGYNDTERRVMRAIESILYDLPTPKQGQWIAIDEEPHEDYECDRCGYVISVYTANIEPHTEYKYCPSCGRRMVETREREDKG